ncbi:WXG100-like domain-containing protein [Streptomyces sp. NPDC039016]|uniref:WXG100-like domain-containing protein n=1 Tax=Streptomyces sp. NPDC039016 TaxID=3154330 RepID=UPI0033E8EEF6
MSTPSINLPSEVDWVLDLLGFDWPDAKEGSIFDASQAWFQFAADVRLAQGTGQTAANAVLSGVNFGDAVQKFEAAWRKYAESGTGYFEVAALAAEVLGAMLAAVAAIVLACKIAVIAQLVALAIELLAAQAAAPVTFGLSEAGAAGATVATRVMVRQILQRLEREVVQKVEEAAEEAATKKAKDIALDALKKAAVAGGKAVGQDLAKQGIKNYFGAQHGIDAGEAALAGGKAAVKTGVSEFAGGMAERKGAQKLLGGSEEGARGGKFVHDAFKAHEAAEGKKEKWGERVDKGFDFVGLGEDKGESGGDSGGESGGGEQETRTERRLRPPVATPPAQESGPHYVPPRDITTMPAPAPAPVPGTESGRNEAERVRNAFG